MVVKVMVLLLLLTLSAGRRARQQRLLFCECGRYKIIRAENQILFFSVAASLFGFVKNLIIVLEMLKSVKNV